MDNLSGRVAVVTGAAGGIGLAMAKSFASQGMKLVMADIEGETLARSVAALRALRQRLSSPSADWMLSSSRRAKSQPSNRVEIGDGVGRWAVTHANCR